MADWEKDMGEIPSILPEMTPTRIWILDFL